jgi:hypothetical protein
MPLLLIILLLSFSSCSYFAPTAPKKTDDITYFYLTGKKRPNEISNTPATKDIRKNLEENMTMAGGNYEVSILPLSRPYLRAQWQERIQERGLNKVDQERMWNEFEKEYLQAKTCFELNYSVLRWEKVSNLKDWKLEMIDHHKTSHPMNWKKTDLKKMPARTKVQRSGDNLDKWLNDGHACVDTKVPLDKGFSVKVTPSFVQFPFDSSSTLHWRFATYVQKDGKEIKVQKKQESFQGYRGW